MKNAVESLLEEDHESLARLLADLDAALAKPDAAKAFELLDLFWARLAVHIRGEHLHLFPALANVPALLFTGKDGLPTSVEAHDLLLCLRSDHDFFMKELARTIKAMREIAGSPLPSFEKTEKVRQRLLVIGKRLETHNDLEEGRVYLWTALLFDQQTVAALLDRLRQELKNIPPRFTKDTPPADQ